MDAVRNGMRVCETDSTKGRPVMSFRLLSCLTLLLVLAPLARPAEFETDPEHGRELVAKNIYMRWDRNHDGKIDAQDKSIWDRVKDNDTDQDGTLSYEELKASRFGKTPPWEGPVLRDVVYKRVGDHTLLMDIYEPTAKKTSPSPVFYYTHGGGWTSGNKAPGSFYADVFKRMTAEGVTCVAVNYRLLPRRGVDRSLVMRDCVVDCKDGLRFLKAHEKTLDIDMNRVVVFGSSAGGHLCMVVTLSGPDDFQGDPDLAAQAVRPVGGISWFGPTDFTRPELFDRPDGKPHFRFTPRITGRPGGGPGGDEIDEEARKMLREMSPVHWLKKDSPPLLLIQGDRDVVIPLPHAPRMLERAETVGANVRAQIVKNAGHGWKAPKGGEIEPDVEAIVTMTVEFALEHLRRP